MAACKLGDVVKVPFPFPYTDRSTRQSRPALVISTAKFVETHGLLWVVMTTSAENRGWSGDVAVMYLALAGPPVASVVRSAKVATIDAADAIRLGKVPSTTIKEVLRQVGEVIGLA